MELNQHCFAQALVVVLSIVFHHENYLSFPGQPSLAYLSIFRCHKEAAAQQQFYSQA